MTASIKPGSHCARVLDLLSDGQPHTHHELYALHVIGHSRISDLRKRGYQIVQWQAEQDGERVYVYQLTGTPLAAASEPSGLLSTASTNIPPRDEAAASGAQQPLWDTGVYPLVCS